MFVYDFNMIVSCLWTETGRAKREIFHFLHLLGDDSPFVQRTLARGIIGVKTKLDSRSVTNSLASIFVEDAAAFRFTFKWVPVDLWVGSDIESMKEVVEKIKDRIKPDETWRMTVEKRRYTSYHKIDIIKELAGLIDAKVDLKNPSKILRIDIIGKYAGISVIVPNEVFSTTRLPVTET